MTSEIIWAPWRAGFITGKPEKGCVFCRVVKSADDRKSLTILRLRHNLVVMNKYPYTSGHLLIVPGRHVRLLSSLTEAEANEHFRLTRRAAEALRRALNCHGMNIGMNLGRIAGAGVVGHLHTHVVPRFSGDSNFMPVVGQTRVMSLDLEPMYARLVRAFERKGKANR
ncbi:MAG: HIT domain-containing protein [Candidatus Zixiibacteriota bacterium]